MLACPRCQVRLKRAKTRAGSFWLCDECSGRAATIPMLRKLLIPDAVNALWHQSRQPGRPKKMTCPACDQPMTEVVIPVDQGHHFIDVCSKCYLVWFDKQEYEEMPPAAKSRLGLSPEARQRLAKLEVEHHKPEYYDTAMGTELPDEWWKYIPGLFGMPIEYEPQWFRRYPLVTWGLSLVILLISVIAFFNLEAFVDTFGLVPAEAMRYGGLTLLTSFFLHGGFMHLAGNLYFFMVFGDNVEDVLGRLRFILLILCATLAGDILHILGDSQSTMPCVGASGGISGVIVYYGLRFPRANLGILFRVIVFLRFIRLPAWSLLMLWLGMQAVGTFLQVNGISNVSALAHLGGAAMGAVFWVFTRRG